MKFCLLVTAALDIFKKEKSNTLYFPWISPLSFFYAKGVYSVKLSGHFPIPPPRIFQSLPSLIIFYTNSQPPCLLESPVYFGP